MSDPIAILVEPYLRYRSPGKLRVLLSMLSRHSVVENREEVEAYVSEWEQGSTPAAGRMLYLNTRKLLECFSEHRLQRLYLYFFRCECILDGQKQSFTNLLQSQEVSSYPIGRTRRKLVASDVAKLLDDNQLSNSARSALNKVFGCSVIYETIDDIKTSDALGNADGCFVGSRAEPVFVLKGSVIERIISSLALEKLQSDAATQAESTPQEVNLRDAKLHIAEKFRNRKPIGVQLDIPTSPRLKSVRSNLR